MIKLLKDRNALTIIEVLVAIILTAIVMLHGTIFFITTWRLSAESKEYNLILNNVIDNLENYIAKTYSTAAINPTNDYYIKTKTKALRGLYDVTYTLRKDNAALFDSQGGFYYLISEATWRYGGDEKSNFKISIKTACARKWDKAI